MLEDPWGQGHQNAQTLIACVNHGNPIQLCVRHDCNIFPACTPDNQVNCNEGAASIDTHIQVALIAQLARFRFRSHLFQPHQADQMFDPHMTGSREREREKLHLFQPPRADQMPDPHQGQGFPYTSQCLIGIPIRVIYQLYV